MPDAPTRVMLLELEDEGIEPYEVPNLLLSSNEPDTYVDITDTIDIKLEALAQHVSEEGEAAPWVRERAHPGRGGRRRVRRGFKCSASQTTMSR